MADKDRDERTEAKATAAVLSLEDQARVLQDLAARQRADAGRLPEPRLDEADEGHHFVVNGQKVDANGAPVKARRD
jgi:hypothetical protein